MERRGLGSRVVIEAVSPEVDCGRFPIKRVIGEEVEIEADIFTDGHDVLRAVLLYRREEDRSWSRARMEALANDRWRGSFIVDDQGRYRYTVEAWIDRFGSWRRDLVKRLEAGQDAGPEFPAGAELVERAAARFKGTARRSLLAAAERIRAGDAEAALDEDLAETLGASPDKASLVRHTRELGIVVDRERARFSSWYEMFPRSASPQPGRHGTFDDVIARLPYVAEMGFDVLYLPPIHPIGHTNRKGRNNTTTAGPDDVGSPWAIGAEEGGHDAIHPDLGTVEDFERLVRAANEHGIEVALDLALQASPDHPWVKKHPQWFRHRPDGSIRYAENPPKKYEDIYPIDFENQDARALWDEVRGIVETWIERGVRIFRVDNPHTKPFRFWEWLIGDVKQAHPDVLFLSEAFTRPKVMNHLAKLGFTQSYTYFAWRVARWELRQYFEELTRTEARDFFRPNLWPNTPDILTEQLQLGGRGAFMSRLILAATLGASYGIYGPAFELMEHIPTQPGREEYLNSEKYQLRHWDLDNPRSLRQLIARVNQIRREHSALQTDRTLLFHNCPNENLIVYSKATPDRREVIIVVVNLDPAWRQAGMVDLALDQLDIDAYRPFQVEDLLTGARYTWQGWHNYVELDPQVAPAHILRVHR